MAGNAHSWRSAAAVAALGMVLAGTAVTLWIIDPPSFEVVGGTRLPWWALALAFAGAEVFVAHVQFRRDAYTYSLSEVPLVLGLLFAAPGDLLLGTVVGAGAALLLHRHQPPLKLGFNLAHLALETTAAVLVHRAVLDGAAPFSLNGWAALYAAALVATAINVISISAAVTLSEGRPADDQLVRTSALAVGIAVTNASLAIAAGLVIDRQPAAAAVLLVPAAALMAAYRGYVRQRERHERLEFLHETTHALQTQRQADVAILALLERACNTFRAGAGELVLLPPAGEAVAHRTSYWMGGRHQSMRRVPLHSNGPIWTLLAAGDTTLVLGDDADAPQRAYLEERGIRDAMVTQLRGESRRLGFFVLGNRLGDVAQFTSEDLRLFETLGRHVAVTLENDRLEDALTRLTELERQLSHQAFHDPLTGLANRALFNAELARRLEAANWVNAVAVLYLDLDDFKEINDRLGHAAGDAVLVEVAARLRRCVRPDDVVARLGGDEFAVLVGTRHGDPTAVADRILGFLGDPIAAAGHEAAVRASIGIATARPGDDVDDVLGHADGAMYRVKAEGKGSRTVYQPEPSDNESRTPHTQHLEASR